MARPSNRTRIERLTNKFEPELKSAFLDAVRDISNRAELKTIVTRLERGDIAGAIEAVHLDPAAYRLLDNAIARAFDEGGASAIGSLPKIRAPGGGQFVVRWDARNIRAETWLREHSSTLITRITVDQRNAIRMALVEGMEAGLNPRSTALNIIGRVNRATKAREGGIIGLTSQQAEQLAAVRRILADPAEIRRFFIKDEATGKWKPRYKLTPRRWDAQIAQAIKEGRALSAADIAKISTVHSNKLLELRGKTIARTETMAALNQSGIEAMQQAIDAGAVKAETVTKIWHTARDPRVRDSHAAQDRQTIGLNEVFGNGLRYPGDPSGGAHETANCRCWLETKIDFTAGLIEEELALAGLT